MKTLNVRQAENKPKNLRRYVVYTWTTLLLNEVLICVNLRFGRMCSVCVVDLVFFPLFGCALYALNATSASRLC